MQRSARTYQEALDFLYGRINYERAQADSLVLRDLKLDRMRRLLEIVGNPQDRIPAVHIAGTKGKGSTAAMLAEMLIAQGYRCGLFTSPHVTTFEERIAVSGVQPTAMELLELVNSVEDAVAELDRDGPEMSPTFFEIVTALGWLFFEQKRAEIVVLEVGLGGRLDATNICRPIVTIVTSISRDHTAVLGHRLSQIAGEKAGIIKPGIPVISGVMQPSAKRVVEQAATRNEAPLWQLGRDVRYRYVPQQQLGDDGSLSRDDRAAVEVQTPIRCWPAMKLNLLGSHQAANAALAVAAGELLNTRGFAVTPAAVSAGIGRTRLPARIEIVRQNPLIVIDAAHNLASTAALVGVIKDVPKRGRRSLIFAVSTDKDARGMLRLLLPHFDDVSVTKYQTNPRGRSAEDVLQAVPEQTKGMIRVVPDPETALRLALASAGENDSVWIAGSFFLAAECRELLLSNTRPADQNQIELAVSVDHTD